MTTKNLLKKIYNVAIIVLAVASIALTIAEMCGKLDLSAGVPYIVDTTILILFAIDYLVRLALAKGARWDFFKHNIFDLIAIIPFNSIFAMFRFARLFRLAKLAKFTKLSKLTKLVRLTAFIGRFTARVKAFLYTNGFIYMLYSSAVLIAASSVIMMYAEGKTFADALWWSIVTVTTVGYGDISPATAIGRIMAVVLMIFGIGLISMLTGTITSFFAAKSAGKKTPSIKIDGVELTEEQAAQVYDYVMQLTAKSTRE